MRDHKERTTGPACMACGRLQSPNWKKKLCYSCFQKWKQKMIDEGRWQEDYQGQRYED